MRSVEYHPKVPAEVRNFLEYDDAISPRLGDVFWSELLEAIADIREFPERHHFDRSGRRRVNLKRFPIHILFRILPDRIRVTAVRHDQQSPERGSGRE